MTAKIPRWFTPTFVLWFNIIACAFNVGCAITDVVMHRWTWLWVNLMAATVGLALGWFTGLWRRYRAIATGTGTK